MRFSQISQIQRPISLITDHVGTYLSAILISIPKFETKFNNVYIFGARF